MPKAENTRADSATLESASAAGETLTEKALLSIAVSLKRLADDHVINLEDEHFPAFGTWPRYDQEADGNGADA